MSKHNEPAFPSVNVVIPPPGHFYISPVAHDGMTLRDYFAAAALQGLCAALVDDKARQMHCDNAAENGISAKAQVAKAAYEYADALLSSRPSGGDPA